MGGCFKTNNIILSHTDLLAHLSLHDSGSNEGYVRGDGTYMVNDVDGTACVMAYFKGTATIYYLDNTGEYRVSVCVFVCPIEPGQSF